MSVLPRATGNGCEVGEPCSGAHIPGGTAGAAPPNWVADAAELHVKHVGIVAYGKLGKILKPAVDLYGWDRLRPVWAYFCEFSPVQHWLDAIEAGRPGTPPEPDRRLGYHTSPQSFVERITHWAAISGHALTSAPASLQGAAS
jgi:hypothetical protein